MINCEITILEPRGRYITSHLQLKIHPSFAGGTVVEALRYKPEGRGFDS
jgi:hypothetical protein